MQITHKYAKWKYIYIIYIPSIQSEGTTLKLFIYFISLKPFLFKLCFILTLAFIAQPLLCLSSNIIKFFINILEKWKIINEEKNNWQRISVVEFFYFTFLGSIWLPTNTPPSLSSSNWNVYHSTSVCMFPKDLQFLSHQCFLRMKVTFSYEY